MRLTLLQILLTQLPQLVDIRRTARDNALRNLHAPANHVRAGNRIRDGLSLDPDDTNTRILGPAVVLAVAEIPEPGF